MKKYCCTTSVFCQPDMGYGLRTKGSSLVWLAAVLLTSLFLSCNPSIISEKEIDLSTYQIEEGFRLEVMASEPLLTAPVAIDFDDRGRIWVLELPGYMADIDGKGENDPTGRILILDDQNGNGRMDRATPFLEGLVAPRAMLLVYDGLLYAEPPNLWYVEIDRNDQPVNKVLVDSAYVLAGNIEHQANSLIWNIDNWIYSAKSNTRYQKRGNQWVKTQTAYRGQWGMTKDHLGRLFYNDNSNQFQGDLVLPMTALNNPYLKPQHSIRLKIVEDQRLYPLHAPAINRGYLEGSLDEEGKPATATSACGPVVYGSALLGPDYYGNAFVCMPEGNLVKRNILREEGERIVGEQAWEGREFIAATDEAFRPVNLYNGPEGALYIVDLHKGIIQHRAYMSPYLRKLIEERQLDTIVGNGRILRVVPDDFDPKAMPDFKSMAVAKLVGLLDHPDVWVRDRAHQQLVWQQKRGAIPLLKQLVRRDSFSIGQVHALWILDGMGVLFFPLLQKAMAASDPHLSGLGYYLLSRADAPKDEAAYVTLAQSLMERNDPRIDLYLAATFGQLSLASDSVLWPFYRQLAARHPQSAAIAELAYSALPENENVLLETVSVVLPTDTTEWTLIGETIAQNRLDDKKNLEMLPAEDDPYLDKRQVGLNLYRRHCATCHGEDGHGIENLAPPLYESDYVSGPPKRLALIILHGLQGPIHVKGKRYEFNAPMPGLTHHPDLSDKDIVAIMTFVRNAFTTDTTYGIGGAPLEEEELAALREETPPEGSMYTEELLK